MQIAAEFITSAAGAGDFPRDRLAEVALVGRSNVGKSSLINALMRRPLARTSAAPGKTRLANFFRVQRGSAPPLYLVDLPGYGYARGGDTSSREFNALTEAYFARAHRTGDVIAGERGGAERPAAAARPGAGPPRDAGEGWRSEGGKAGPPKDLAVLLLVDARHPGLDSDLEAWAWLGSKPCPRGIVVTKVDKLTRAERARHSRQFETLFDVPVPLVSARTGEGLEELWKLIVRLPSQTAA